MNKMKFALQGVAWGLGISLAGVGCAGPNEDVPTDDVELTAATDLFEPAADQAADAGQVLVRVDGVDITQEELVGEMNMMMGRMQGQQIPPEQMAQLQEQMAQGIMENLIVRRLLLNQVEKDAVQVEEEEIDSLIAMYRQQMPGDTSLEEQLAQMNMSEDQFRDNVRSELRVNKMLEEKVAHVGEPSAEEVEAFHTAHLDEYFSVPASVRARHILITVEEDAADAELAAAREQAENLRAQLLDGADFSELAMEHSDCPSGQRGGDLGQFGRGQMVPAFEEAAFAQEIGAIGEVVESDFGFHIIKVDEQIEAGIQPLEEAADQIAQFLQSQAREDALRAYVEQLREDADIEFLGAP